MLSSQSAALPMTRACYAQTFATIRPLPEHDRCMGSTHENTSPLIDILQSLTDGKPFVFVIMPFGTKGRSSTRSPTSSAKHFPIFCASTRGWSGCRLRFTHEDSAPEFDHPAWPTSII